MQHYSSGSFRSPSENFSLPGTCENLLLVHNIEGALSHVNHARCISSLFDEEMADLKDKTLQGKCFICESFSTL